MITISANSIGYLQFHLFSTFPPLVHAFSLKGTRPYLGNMAFSRAAQCGDPRSARKALCKELGLPIDRVTVAGQVHSSNVALIAEAQAGSGALNSTNVIQQTDALITETKNIPLLVTAADCPAVFLFDSKRPAIGLVHSGWRGAVAEIVPKTFVAMQKTFSSDPQHIYAAISPSIGACCYEVKSDLMEQLKPADLVFIQAKGDKSFFNLGQLIKKQLLESGVLEEHIELSDLCTACKNRHFFSHRAEGDKAGRNAAVFALR